MKGYVLIGLALLLAGCETAKPVVTPPPPQRVVVKPQRPATPPPAPAKPPAPVRLATGDYMDNQEAALRKRISAGDVKISRLGDDILITMPNEYLFGDNAGGVSWNATDTLNSIAEVLQQYDETLVQVAGYTDTTGSPDNNLRVSQARAKIVADMLARDGVAPDRIAAQGYGETHLKVPTGDSVNQPRNRRVEIRIVPHRQS